MHVLYDYEQIIDELKDDLHNNVLALTDVIQILRSDESIAGNYKPIIDWYYNDKKMKEDLMLNSFDTDLKIKEKNSMKKQYFKDKPFLQRISVEQCIVEMDQYNRMI